MSKTEQWGAVKTILTHIQQMKPGVWKTMRRDVHVHKPPGHIGLSVDVLCMYDTRAALKETRA